MSGVAPPNRELVVFALALLGGESKRVHTEDLAVKCHELYPQAFSWSKYPKLPDKEIVRMGLKDARKEQNGGLVTGRTGTRRGQSTKTRREPAPDGWTLTPAGVKWLKTNEHRFETSLEHGAPKEHRQQVLKQMKRLRAHPLFARFTEDEGRFSASVGELAELIKCRVDAPPAIWTRRFDQLEARASLADQEDATKFVAACRQAYGDHG